MFNISGDGTVVTCGCTHLTTFSLSSDETVPEANILTELDWRRLTLSNVLKHPTVLVTSLCVLAVMLAVCWINPRSGSIRSKPIVAVEDIIFRSVQDELLWRDIVGLEIKYFSRYIPSHRLGLGLLHMAKTRDDRRSICTLQAKLFRSYLRNDHTLLSVFQRSAGTNFSLKQRLGLFYMYVQC